MFNPASRITPTEPEKELRFTRSRQAAGFAAVGGLAMAGLIVAAVNHWQAAATGLTPTIAWWWMIPLAVVAAAGFWAAAFLTVHAYLLLTPLGIEIFPFWRPATNFRIIHWSEIKRLQIDEAPPHLTIDLKGGGGVVLSLAPLTHRSRTLLRRALEGRTQGPDAS
ncbi:hypothetical protein [Sulfuriroseicoccus oceanibius]|uniref:DUF304 domain-containing protein n=1 Tax=Sulfuriroseicoccus oceanibius TaxID=2707525 RepID=A0A6B3LBF5_9BACT|nr:hypothetical protein [Sulfuriroseicoccus oceanibius]QQL45590.1 hypothetical protein G3M56_003095 [Sulfuriroseicoccus oceanibius]